MSGVVEWTVSPVGVLGKGSSYPESLRPMDEGNGSKAHDPLLNKQTTNQPQDKEGVNYPYSPCIVF